MRNYNRYYLEQDQKLVGEDAIVIRKRTTRVESGIASVKFRKGILDGLEGEEAKIEFILEMVNRIEDGIERSERRSGKSSLEDKIMTEEEWRALVHHESEAEVPPVPTYKQIVEYVYETALRDAGERADSSRAE